MILSKSLGGLKLTFWTSLVKVGMVWQQVADSLFQIAFMSVKRGYYMSSDVRIY